MFIFFNYKIGVLRPLLSNWKGRSLKVKGNEYPQIVYSKIIKIGDFVLDVSIFILMRKAFQLA